MGEQHLRDFQDNDKTIPTILTTSQKLSTGVDARNVRNIVLMRPIRSMIEFKQIIGRGTRTYAPWRDLPERYGPRTTCYNRFVQWRKAGVWDRMMDAITVAHDGDIQMIDSTSIRAHQQAATAKRGIEIIVSVVPVAASRPKSTRLSTGKASRSG